MIDAFTMTLIARAPQLTRGAWAAGESGGRGTPAQISLSLTRHYSSCRDGGVDLNVSEALVRPWAQCPLYIYKYSAPVGAVPRASLSGTPSRPPT